MDETEVMTSCVFPLAPTAGSGYEPALPQRNVRVAIKGFVNSKQEWTC